MHVCVYLCVYPHSEPYLSDLKGLEEKKVRSQKPVHTHINYSADWPFIVHNIGKAFIFWHLQACRRKNATLVYGNKYTFDLFRLLYRTQKRFYHDDGCSYHLVKKLYVTISWFGQQYHLLLSGLVVLISLFGVILLYTLLFVQRLSYFVFIWRGKQGSFHCGIDSGAHIILFSTSG